MSRRVRMATEAKVDDKLTYRDVEKLCERHLAHRSLAGLAGYRLVRYERSESQRFRPAFPSVCEFILERVDFDRAFRRIERCHQKVLIAWYGMDGMSIDDMAEKWGCHRATVIRRKHRAVRALWDVLTSATVKG